MDVRQNIYSAIEPILADSGYELVDLSYYRRSPKKMGIIVTVDRIDETPLTLADCKKATKLIKDLLEEIVSADYILEVSSPGLNRVLTKPRHFERFVGENVEVKLITPIEEDCSRYSGIIKKAEDEGFLLELDDNTSTIHIKYNNIQKAKLKYKRH